MKIYLDGQVYELRGTLNRQPIIEWPDNIRYDGQQLRKDRRLISAWEINDVSGGLGKKVDSSGGKRLWDVENVDTRFAGQKVLSPALTVCNIVPSWGNLRTVLDYQNALYFFQGSADPTHLYKFAAPQTIGSNIVIGSTNCISGLVIGAHALGGNLVLAATPDGDGAHFIALGSLGDVGTTRDHFAGALGLYDVKFADIGGTVHAISYDQTNLGYNLYVIPRLLGTLSPIASYAGPVGTNLAPLVSDGVKVYAAFPDGIYNFDAIPDKIIDTSRSVDKNPNQVMFQNYLYFKNKYSTIRYDGVEILSKGYDTEDGLPSDKMGEITAFAANWQSTFAAVKGASYSHILNHNGSAWQYYARWPSMGIWIKDMFLSDSPDGIDRLWCIPGNAAQIGYFLNPMVNPLQAGTYAYVPSGYYTPPIYDAGMPEIQAGWLRGILNSDNINGTNAAFLKYALDGGNSFATLGLAGTTHAEMIFGSPYGLAGYRIQPRIEMFRNSALTGTTPIVRDALINFLKDPNKRYTYEFDVDLEKTAKEWQKPIEAVIGSLNYVTNLKTLSPFWYGRIATTQVKVLDQPAIEGDKESANNIFQPERTGFIRVRVAEIL